MPKFNPDEIAGYMVDGDYVHVDCATEEEKEEITLEDILLRTQIDESDDEYICSRCFKRIS
jgi:hypothetical protein